jgi:hypothetical protein
MSLSEITTPTRIGQVVFSMKASGLRLRRHFRNLKDRVEKCPSGKQEDFPHVLVEIRTSLFSGATGAERALEIGKVQNLRVAARKLNRLVIPANSVFSFWRELGKCTRGRGYIQGRQLQEGCLIPAIGGGLCQLSNSLYQAALKGRLEIVERHPHSRIVSGSAAEQGLDATVAWNYIDLRFRTPQPTLLTVRLTSDELIVSLRSAVAAKSRRTLLPLIDGRHSLDSERHSCASCEQTDCFREGAASVKLAEKTAFLLDEWWPEFNPYLDEFENAELYAPLNGKRFKRPAYVFPTNRFSQTRYATLPTLVRAVKQRHLPRQGSQLQKALLANAESLAETYAKQVDPQATHLTVSIGLLPFLWRLGVLGGRTYDVFMTRDSMGSIQQRLDVAAAQHPDRRLLSDFRAKEELVRDEIEALRGARRVVTPHAAIAAAWPNAHRLPWPTPSAKAYKPGTAIVFPGPTIARKGAYEVREVARQLDLEVALLGNELEGDGFWKGIHTRRVNRDENWLDGVCAVVQPAIVEHRPRALLTALASGCPVIATEACGLGDMPGWHCVEAGDVDTIVEVIKMVSQSVK